MFQINMFCNWWWLNRYKKFRKTSAPPKRWELAVRNRYTDTTCLWSLCLLLSYPVWTISFALSSCEEPLLNFHPSIPGYSKCWRNGWRCPKRNWNTILSLFQHWANSWRRMLLKVLLKKPNTFALFVLGSALPWWVDTKQDLLSSLISLLSILVFFYSFILFLSLLSSLQKERRSPLPSPKERN